jgi:hypothetical protein
MFNKAAEASKALHFYARSSYWNGFDQGAALYLQGGSA